MSFHSTRAISPSFRTRTSISDSTSVKASGILSHKAVYPNSSKEGASVKKNFYLADTAWAASYKARTEEWKEYLDFRKKQGFNAIQMNLLPWEKNVSPFPFLNGKINEEYFSAVEEKVEETVKRGFKPVLVLVWCNYVPGTWATVQNGELILPLRVLLEYCEYVIDRFRKYEPLFVMGGDVDFRTKEAIEYYSTIADVAKRVLKETPIGLHLSRGLCDIPYEIDKYVDLYMYQSGHDRHNQDLSWKLAEKFYSKGKKFVNAEICYEGIGYRGDHYRFGRKDVRRATWQSVLSGAEGIGYGAHGIWNWHRKGERESERHLPSFTWREALFFEGAWDVSFAKWLMEKFDISKLEPANHVLVSPKSPEIRIAMGENRCVVFLPFDTELVIEAKKPVREAYIIDLEKRVVMNGVFERKQEGLRINPPGTNSDYLIVLEFD